MKGAKAFRLALVLIAVGLAAKGIAQLVTIPETGYDLRLLWTSTQYYLRGTNPFEASVYADDFVRGVTHATVPTFFPDLGWPEQVNYPPSSTLTLILLFAQPRVLMYGCYLLVNVAAMAAVAWWGSHELSRVEAGTWGGWGVALANLGYSQTLINGNLGIVVMAALVLSISMRDRRPWASGLLLGVALVKPTLALPFLWLFVLDRQIRILAICALYLAGSVLLTMALSGAGLVTLLRQTVEGSARFATGGYALWQSFRGLGWSQSASLLANAALVLVPFVLVSAYLIRRIGAFDLRLLALAGVAARLFTYHNSIDNVLLTFLAVALYARASARWNVADVIPLLLLVASVLIPFTLTNSVAGHLALYAVWIVAAAALWRRAS